MTWSDHLLQDHAPIHVRLEQRGFVRRAIEKHLTRSGESQFRVPGTIATGTYMQLLALLHPTIVSVAQKSSALGPKLGPGLV
jgi:hypothetical protein